ncbi:hypothetical protein [Mesobacillus sp. S13]|uniref:hypothetical protein n=1 Tax=Mesobacillus sp. S13 TaxID=2880221 RepID=UPI001CF5B72D|nr:hypothetical protein [Mesobacillus sp. S13]
MGVLTYIKDYLGPIWDLLLIGVGAVFNKLYIYIKEFRRRKLVQRRLKQTTELEELNILTLSSANPCFEKSAIETKLTDKELYISFPSELLSKVKENDPGFEVYTNHSFNGKDDFQDLAQRTEISDLVELIEKHRYIVASHFVTMSEGCKFNRSKLGVYNFVSRKSSDEHENPCVKLDLFKTDYFTHRVFRSIYNELKERNHPISKVKTVDELRKYNAFTTSLGINAFIFMESAQGESIIFSRRSVNAAYSENYLKYNSSIMEGVSLTDYDRNDNVVSLRLGLEKGLMEELGVSTAYLTTLNIRDIEFCDFFLERNYFEIGVTASIEISGVFEETIKDLPAKDKELEVDKLIAVQRRKKIIEEFIKNENVYGQAMYTLKMLLARKMIFINLPKKDD